jgi:hypothetical protein
MLVRLFYVSTAVGPQTTTVTQSVLEHSRKNNAAKGITGLLGQGRGLFLQVLEGERGAVNRLYQTICQDSRHTRVELLSYEHITDRKYGQWSMALIDLSRDDPMVAMNHPDFDPYSANDQTMTSRLEELLAARIPIN